MEKRLGVNQLLWMILCIIGGYMVLGNSFVIASPPLQHGKNFDKTMEGTIDIADYYVSEKLDGVRGYWDGEQLLTRQGNPIMAPEWFTAALGDDALDGELWIGRDQFAELSGIVRQTEADDDAWRRVKFMIFDLPHHKGTFKERVKAMKRIVDHLNQPWIQKIPQERFNHLSAMEAYHQSIIAKKGEGLMLHHQDAYYQSGRVNHLLKVKEAHDREGRVLAHFKGEGKYSEMMGSLLIEIEGEKRFKLGTGFTDEERANPPAIGECVTFQYNGYTNNGIPRFARFLRIREDATAECF